MITWKDINYVQKCSYYYKEIILGQLGWLKLGKSLPNALSVHFVHVTSKSWSNRADRDSTYFLLAECKALRQVMDQVFSFLLWPTCEARGPWKQGRKKRRSITCRTDQANENNKMFIIWLCWFSGFENLRWLTAPGPYSYLQTWY